MSSEHRGAPTAALINVEYGLRCLAKAFERVGNDQVAQEVYAYANQLVLIREQVHDEHGGLLKQYIDSIGQSSVNVLESALAGCKLGMESKGEP